MRDRSFVVVVDDDDAVRKALARLLRAARMEVETYPSGESFLRGLGARLPDCLVLDIRMPHMTGPQLRERLGSLGHRIPIVFITAHGEERAAERGAAIGLPETVLKPFGDEELLDAIDRSMRRKSA